MHRLQIPRFMKLAFALALILSVFAAGSSSTLARGNVGAVYVLTNQAAGNEVAVFDRAANGALTTAVTVSTGGLGTGSGLGSQGALALSNDEDWLFAVNAGSNDISVFSVSNRGLTLVDRDSSGGIMPIGVTSYHNLLYVLNAGGSGNITGFTVGNDGSLNAIAGSTRPLSNGAAGPAQVQFSPDGNVLVVTEKATNMIDTYVVNGDGTTTGPHIYAAAGTTPFGFAFTNKGDIVVSEAFGGSANASAASSYWVGSDGSIGTVSPSSPTHQTAACWVAVTNNGRYAYTTNAGSGSVSGYSVAPDGTLALLNADGRTGVTGAGSSPTDVGLSRNSHFLYVLTSGAHGISAFSVSSDGSLTTMDGITGLPVGTVGLAAR